MFGPKTGCDFHSSLYPVTHFLNFESLVSYTAMGERRDSLVELLIDFG